MKKLVILGLFCSMIGVVSNSFAGLQEGLEALDQSDYKTALREIAPLAEQGNAEAQNLLGAMYFEGLEVKQDFAQARMWFRKAADQGHAEAQSNLGIIYNYGRGVDQDYAEAAKWFRKAADQGYASAQNNLGFMYEKGKGVLQDYTEAVRWYRKAAIQGEAQAQRNMGVVYRDGIARSVNPIMAYIWFNLASVSGHKDAASDRDKVGGELTPKELLQAQKASASWQVGKDIPDIKYTPPKATKKKNSAGAPNNANEQVASSASNGDCRPRSTSLRCSSSCSNGNCIVTYENGCKLQVQVQPRFNGFTNTWEYPAPSC